MWRQNARFQFYYGNVLVMNINDAVRKVLGNLPAGSTYVMKILEPRLRLVIKTNLLRLLLVFKSKIVVYFSSKDSLISERTLNFICVLFTFSFICHVRNHVSLFVMRCILLHF